MQNRSILASTFAPFLAFASIACGGGVATTPDAGNNNNNDNGNDAATQPETSTTVDAGPDVDYGSPSSSYPAFTIDAPQVVNGNGGPVLATPKVVPVYFGNDDTSVTGQITSYLNALPTSTYWGPSVKEYGVGAITVTAPIQLTESASNIDDSAIQTWLQGKLTSNDPAWPAPDANTVYALFYPTGVTITLQGETSCSSFGGYHNDTTINTSTNIAYAVVPRCGSFGSLTGIDAITAPASHEIIEASTDPYPSANPAFSQVDNDHIYWEFLLGGGEVGDMCAQFSTSFYTPTDLGFTVQRTWSDYSANAGHDPCQPADGTPYFNSMPVLTDSVTIEGQITSKGVIVPVGQTKTIEVDLFSDAPTSGPWTITADDASMLDGSSSTLQLSLDRSTGVNGEKVHLSITTTAMSQYGASAFILRSELGTRHTDWFGLVGYQ